MKVRNRGRVYLAINLPNKESIHLSGRETSRDLTEDELNSKEIQKLILRGVLVTVASDAV